MAFANLQKHPALDIIGAKGSIMCRAQSAESRLANNGKSGSVDHACTSLLAVSEMKAEDAPKVGTMDGRQTRQWLATAGQTAAHHSRTITSRGWRGESCMQIITDAVVVTIHNHQL